MLIIRTLDKLSGVWYQRQTKNEDGQLANGRDSRLWQHVATCTSGPILSPPGKIVLVFEYEPK